MATKTISLDEKAYEQLKAHKKEGESFSDVVKRLAGERSWSEVTGILSPDEAEAFEDTIAESRSRSRARSDRIADKLDAATDRDGSK